MFSPISHLSNLIFRHAPISPTPSAHISSRDYGSYTYLDPEDDEKQLYVIHEEDEFDTIDKKKKVQPIKTKFTTQLKRL